MKREFKDLMIYNPYEYLNSEITGDYDEAHAVKCVNGTFVGTEEHGRHFKAPEYVDEHPR